VGFQEEVYLEGEKYLQFAFRWGPKISGYWGGMENNEGRPRARGVVSGFPNSLLWLI